MSYPKGEICINPQRDIPLLALVRDSRFITRSQAFELLKPGSAEYSPKSFNWRFRRLLAMNYLERVAGNFGKGREVYRITSEGLSQVEGYCGCNLVFNSKTKQSKNTPLVQHALALTDIRVALTKAKILSGWKTDLDMASLNMSTGNAFQKNYDAVVEVWLEDKTSARFGLEYERTLKGLRHYKKIKEVIEGEDRLGCVLYLTAGYDMAEYLAKQLAGSSCKIVFADLVAFRTHLLDTLVLTDENLQEAQFRSLLRGMF